MVRADPFAKSCVLTGTPLHPTPPKREPPPSILTLKSFHIDLSFRVSNAIKEHQKAPEHASLSLLRTKGNLKDCPNRVAMSWVQPC